MSGHRVSSIPLHADFKGSYFVYHFNPLMMRDEWCDVILLLPLFLFPCVVWMTRVGEEVAGSA